MLKNTTRSFIFFLVCYFFSSNVFAHHVLGRPAYQLNEDSNTPSSMYVETQVGEYFVTYMIFPAFPKPNSPGRINLYAKQVVNNIPYEGKVTFTVKNDSWLNPNPELLGTQRPDDTVYRQGFVFKDNGDYIISARLDIDGGHHVIDFPLRVGEKSAIGPFGIAVVLLLIILIGAKLWQRKRLLRETIRDANRKQIG